MNKVRRIHHGGKSNASKMRPTLTSRAIGNKSGSQLCILTSLVVYATQYDSVRPSIWMATSNASATHSVPLAAGRYRSCDRFLGHRREQQNSPETVDLEALATVPAASDERLDLQVPPRWSKCDSVGTER